MFCVCVVVEGGRLTRPTLAPPFRRQHWYRAGLINALTPWSGGYGSQTRDGSFTVGPMVWATAHTTQFTAADGSWRYMLQSIGSDDGSGSGLLDGCRAAASDDEDMLGDEEALSLAEELCGPGLQTESQTDHAARVLAAKLKVQQVWTCRTRKVSKVKK